MLLLKILIVPAIIYFVSVAGRVLGPVVSGLLGGLPIIVGPILLFLNFEQGSEFATHAALGALTSVSSLAGFCFIYSQLSRIFGTSLTLMGSVATFLALAAGFSSWSLEPGAALVFALVSIVCSYRFLPRVRVPITKYSVPTTEIVFRMAAAALLVFAITGASPLLGPRFSGLLAPFPIAGTILAGFTQYYYGHEATVMLLAGFLRGLIAMAVFDYALIMLSPGLGFEEAFVMAIGCALATGLVVARAWTIPSVACAGDAAESAGRRSEPPLFKEELLE